MKNKSLNMSRTGYLWLVVWVLLLSSQIESPAQSHIEKIASDQISITIDSFTNESISILQLTDLHLGGKGKWKDDINTFRRINRLVEMYDPDLLALTGDVFAGKEMSAIVIRHFDELQRPWLYVFGNHDAEGDIDRDGIYDVFSESLWGILGYHKDSSLAGRKYDYCVDISLKGESNPLWQIYGLDTGPHEEVKAIQPGQVAWYKDKSQEGKDKYGTMPRAISIFHIPFIQYQYLWDDISIHKEGESREKVWYEEDDGSTYEAFVEVGNIEATFCGHDHYNNYWGEYSGGIILSYGYISGEATNEAWPTGGKLITLPLDKGEIQIKNVVPVFDNKQEKKINHDN
jgi:3',5'-cyclic AMP phosphodiesterase CpdA